MEADLRAHALSVTGTMPTHPVPGDGHCFFRSVAFQTQAGEGAHGELRAAVVRAVAADAEAYVHFLVEGNIGGWLAGMVGSEWADDLAVQACVNLLRRPVLIWRLGLEQEPTLKVPWFWGPTEPVRPIYLLLDETRTWMRTLQRAGATGGYFRRKSCCGGGPRASLGKPAATRDISLEANPKERSTNKCQSRKRQCQTSSLQCPSAKTQARGQEQQVKGQA